MFEYMAVQEAIEFWSIPVRRVQRLLAPLFSSVLPAVDRHFITEMIIMKLLK